MAGKSSGQKQRLRHTDEISVGAFANYASDYISAAKILLQADKSLTNPILYCCAHALESILKAFLRCNGHSTAILSSKDLGHNLTALLNLANESGFKSLSLDTIEMQNITELLNDANKFSGLRYFSTVGSVRPENSWAVEFTDTLILNVRGFLTKHGHLSDISGEAIKLDIVFGRPEPY